MASKTAWPRGGTRFRKRRLVTENGKGTWGIHSSLHSTQSLTQILLYDHSVPALLLTLVDNKHTLINVCSLWLKCYFLTEALLKTKPVLSLL